jgi:hypothetical protein
MKSFLFSVLLFATIGCSSTAEISQSWVDKDIHNKDLSGTLVVALSDNKNNQVAFENMFVQKLVAKGVRAEASHKIKSKKITSEEIVAYAKQQGLDTVLVTHYAGADQTELYHYGATLYRFDYYYGRAYEVAHRPSFKTSTTDLMLVTTLYETATKEVLWDANSVAQQSDDPRELIEPFIESFVEQLKKDGLTK